MRSWMIGLSTAAVALVLPTAAHAKARIAKCVLTDASGKHGAACKFLPEAGGSFSIEPIKKGALGPDTTLVSVTVVSSGMAEVSGLAPGGNTSRWGSAARSNADRACWKGEDFEICVY